MLSAADVEDLVQGIRAVLAKECDRRALHAHVDGETAIAARLWRQGAELGWPAIALPESMGGVGAGAAGLWALHRELGAHLAPGPWLATTVASHVLASLDLPLPGALASGQHGAAFPAAPGGPLLPGAAPQVLSLRDGRLTGELRGLIGQAEARVVLTPAQAGDTCVWAIVCLPAPGATLREERLWDRTRTLCTLWCGDVQPLRVLDPTASRRVEAALRRDLHLALIADSLGGAEAILDQTVQYLRERVQFGKPIGSFQALKHRAANMKLAVEQARHLGEQARAAAVAERADAVLWSALGKVAATDAFVAIAADAIQLHGGIGFTWEYDAHLFLKRARLNLALGGDNAGLRDNASSALLQTIADGTSAMEILA